MPKCVQCQNYFHPDWSVIVDEANGACKCTFCYTGKTELTIEESDGKPSYKVTKGDAILNYKIYIQDLKESEKIQKAMMKGQPNPFKN